MKYLQATLILIFLIAACTEAQTLQGTLYVGLIAIGSLAGAVGLEKYKEAV